MQDLTSLPLGHLASLAAVFVLVLNGFRWFSKRQEQGITWPDISYSLASVVAFGSSTAIVGYVFKIKQFYSWTPGVEISMITSIFFFLISLAVMILAYGQHARKGSR